MRADALFFLAIFVFIFVAWVATGGPQKPISFAGPFITPVTNVGQEQRGYGDFWDVPKSEGGSWWDWTKNTESGGTSQNQIWRTQEKVEDLQRELQEARLFGPPSVYKDVVSLSASGSVLSKTDPDEEYVIIAVSGSAKESINMSGWKIVSVRKKESATLPPAAAVFRSGSVNQTAPLTLAPGERAIVVSGKSPVGVSFRENACTGYLADRQDFAPALSNSCPSALDDFARFYDGASSSYQACKDKVADLDRCETGTRSDASGTCYQFMREHLTYNGCVQYHAADRNFWSRTWRVYLGESRDDLWSDRNETLKLLDAAGNTVDMVSY